VIDAVRRGQRAVLREQVLDELGAAGLERGADETGRVLFMMADDNDTHELTS
jgi:hypothetical protein